MSVCALLCSSRPCYQWLSSGSLGRPRTNKNTPELLSLRQSKHAIPILFQLSRDIFTLFHYQKRFVIGGISLRIEQFQTSLNPLRSMLLQLVVSIFRENKPEYVMLFRRNRGTIESLRGHVRDQGSSAVP